MMPLNICNFVLVHLMCLLLPTASSKVFLNDNGYEGVVFAIEHNLPQSKCQEVLMGLEALVRESSSVIFQTTRQRAFFKGVTVLVPPSWGPSGCEMLQGKLMTATHEAYDQADVRVTRGRHPHYGARPWALQSKGCAQPGDYISVGHEILYQNDTQRHGRLLAHSWLKYRYGIFEEIGTPDSTIHPTTYRGPDGRWAPNSCGNLNLLQEGQELCDSRDLSCPEDIPSAKNVQGLSSSFMAFPETHSITELCDEGTHNPHAPTPHNLICGAKSVWEVLRASPDFQNNRNVEGRSRPGDVTFKYVRPKEPRMVLLVEDTNVMNVQKRWSFMRKAVWKMVTYDIPDGFSVGLVVFNSQARKKYPLKPINDGNSRYNLVSSLPRNPSRIDKHKRCVFCGIEKSLEMLKQNGGTAGGHIVLMMAGSGHIGASELERVNKLLAPTNVMLHVIIYPLTDKFPEPMGGMEAIAAETRGLSFTIPDEGIGADSKIVMYSNLMDALYHILNEAAGDRVLPVKVHSAEHAGGLTNSEGSFWVDPGLGSNTAFSVFYYDVAHVGDAIHLTSPKGQVIDTGNMQVEDNNMNMVTIKFREDQEAPGLWHYRLENRADSHQALFVQVTSKPRNHPDASKVKVRAWTNHPHGEVNLTNISSLLKIYAEVRVDLAPVTRARVTAVLTRLGFHTNGTVHKPIHMTLLDNGLLSPDIKRGDGIYSRYAPEIPFGKYSIVVNVEGHLGEHKFTRQLRLGIINIAGTRPTKDSIPPARITDLRVALLPETGGSISLTWTAPGSDKDYGQAQIYRVLASNSIEELRDESGQILEGWPRPLPALSIQQHTMTWKTFDQVTYLGLYAIDQESNMAPLSNIIEIYVPTPLTTPPSYVVTLPSAPKEGQEFSSASSPIFEGFRTKQLFLILGCLVFILLVAVIAICYCKNQRRKSKADPEKGTQSREGYNVSLTIGTKGTNFPDEKKDPIKKDYLRPINSWSPSELLANQDKRSSISGRSDNNSDHSGSTKKSYGGSSEPPQYYPSNAAYSYDTSGYHEAYPVPNEGYPTSVEGYHQQASGMYPPSEAYPQDGFVLPPEVRSYMSSQPSDSFMSESCDILPGSQGPPGYSYSPYDAASLRGSKVPPPVPPKPQVKYTPEPYPYDGPDAATNSSTGSITSEKRVRNVTMV